MSEREQDTLTRRFLFSLMDDIVEEDTRHLRGEKVDSKRQKASKGHMDAALSVLLGVSGNAEAVPRKPKSRAGWAKGVLERVDALPPQAKVTQVRKVKRRRVSHSGQPGLDGLADRASDQTDLSAQPHGHEEANLDSERPVRKVRAKAVRRTVFNR